MNYHLLSENYQINRLTEKDCEAILQIYLSNPLYFQYCPPFPNKESILEDLFALPNGKTLDDKFFLGFYQENELVAILDLIIGYPKKDIVFVGLFMVDKNVQKQGIGSRIIRNLCDSLSQQSYQQIQLGWVKGNPQAERFWKKNGFIEVGERVSGEDRVVVLAKKDLK